MNPFFRAVSTQFTVTFDFSCEKRRISLSFQSWYPVRILRSPYSIVIIPSWCHSRWRRAIDHSHASEQILPLIFFSSAIIKIAICDTNKSNPRFTFFVCIRCIRWISILRDKTFYPTKMHLYRNQSVLVWSNSHSLCFRLYATRKTGKQKESSRSQDILDENWWNKMRWEIGIKRISVHMIIGARNGSTKVWVRNDIRTKGLAKQKASDSLRCETRNQWKGTQKEKWDVTGAGKTLNTACEHGQTASFTEIK